MSRKVLFAFFAIIIAMGSMFPMQVNAQTTAVQVKVADSVFTSEEINISVEITNVQDRKIFAYQGELIYDPNILEFKQLEMNGLSTGFNVAVNPSEPGRVRFAAYGIYPITTDGTLMQVEFNSLQENVTSEVFLGQFMFNEGNPPMSAFPGQISIRPESVNLSGIVRYWSNGVPVENAILSYTDPYETQPRIAQSDQNGFYNLELPNNAQGRMTAFRSGDDSVITIYDAAYALGCFVYGWGCNPYIGDVTADLTIGATDAREIARYALGYRDDSNRLVGMWIFFSPYVQFYGLTEDYVENFNAAQKGNLSGNYGGILTATEAASTQDLFNVTTDSESIKIGITGFPVQSVQFQLEGNVEVESVTADGFEVLTNGNLVGLYRDSQVESLEIVVKISVSSETEVKISDFRIDDDMLVYELWQGIVGPPATTPHETWLPSVLFQTEEEEMPILLPD